MCQTLTSTAELVSSTEKVKSQYGTPKTSPQKIEKQREEETINKKERKLHELTNIKTAISGQTCDCIFTVVHNIT